MLGEEGSNYYSLRVQFPSETPKSPLRTISSTRNRPYLLKREIDSWCLEDRGNCSLLPLHFDDGGGFGFWIVLSISHRHSAFSLAWPTRLSTFPVRYFPNLHLFQGFESHLHLKWEIHMKESEEVSLKELSANEKNDKSLLEYGENWAPYFEVLHVLGGQKII